MGHWGFLWWAPSAKKKDHHGVSSGWSSVWYRSNTGLSSTKYEQIPIILGVWPFWLTPIFFGQSLRWRHNDHAGVSNHQPHGCLLNRLFRRKSKKISKLRVTGLCAGNSPGTGEFPAQMASYAENVSIWWRHHGNILAGFWFIVLPLLKLLSFLWLAYYCNIGLCFSIRV